MFTPIEVEQHAWGDGAGCAFVYAARPERITPFVYVVDANQDRAKQTALAELLKVKTVVHPHVWPGAEWHPPMALVGRRRIQWKN